MSESPPLGEKPVVLFVPAVSSLAQTLFPLVIKNSGPATPLVSCHPKGEEAGSAILLMMERFPLAGLSIGNGNTL